MEVFFSEASVSHQIYSECFQSILHIRPYISNPAPGAGSYLAEVRQMLEWKSHTLKASKENIGIPWSLAWLALVVNLT